LWNRICERGISFTRKRTDGKKELRKILKRKKGDIMKKSFMNLIIFICLFLCCFSCNKPPATEELDADITALNHELNNAETKSKQYSGGLIKILIDIKKGILTNSKLMLEQKRSGLKRFININYTVNGEKYLPPQHKEELLKNIQDEIKNINSEISKVQRESDRYAGGLIKVMLEVRIATLGNSLAFIKQKELLMKYDIPFYSVIPKYDGEERKKQFKTTPGKDIDKF
jgi:hypothetical protein